MYFPLPTTVADKTDQCQKKKNYCFSHCVLLCACHTTNITVKQGQCKKKQQDFSSFSHSSNLKDLNYFHPYQPFTVANKTDYCQKMKNYCLSHCVLFCACHTTNITVKQGQCKKSSKTFLLFLVRQIKRFELLPPLPTTHCGRQN